MTIPKKPDGTCIVATRKLLLFLQVPTLENQGIEPLPRLMSMPKRNTYLLLSTVEATESMVAIIRSMTVLILLIEVHFWLKDLAISLIEYNTPS
jgi:hypothetical protein